jgi:Carboxypeptidase regulatory-like domain
MRSVISFLRAQSKFRRDFGHKRHFLLLAALLIIGLHPAQAQQLGGISGTVTDSSGAVIANAKVTVTDPASGVVYHTATNSAGTFLLVNVTPSSYTIKVEAPGFTAFQQDDFRVDIGATADLQASLKAGAGSETVKVTGATTPLLTEQPDIGTTIEPALWNVLPLEINGAGRDFRVAALSNVPGVQNFESGYGKIGGSQTGGEFNYFNGLPQNSNATMLPPYDFINETHVDVTNIDAEWGWGVGYLQFQTKFGTNNLHGSAFEINRNSLFDSRGLDNPTTPSDHQNNYGFSVGGPVEFPKIYHGRDRTFFYFSYEKFVQNNAATGFSPTGYTTVPTAAMKTGDFTGLMTVNANGQVVQAPIYDPDSPDPNHPNQFQSNGVLNVIPSDRISTVSQALLQYLPSPNATGTGPGNLANNYYYNVNVPAHLNRWGASIDEHINARHSINVAFDDSRTTFYSDYQGAPIFGGASNSTNPLSGLYAESWPGGFVYGNYVWSVKPNVIFTAGVSIPFDYRHTLGGLEPKTTIAPQQLAGAPALAFPTVNFGGIAAPTGWGIGSGRGGEVLKTPYFAAYANTNWTVARHTLNFGVQGMYYKNYGWACSGCVGTFTFSGNTTDNSISSTGNFTPNPYAGSPFASFLIGEADSAALSYSPPTTVMYGAYGLYLQDVFKFSPRLTINSGIRWDIQPPYRTNNNEQDFVTPTSLTQPNPAASGQLGALTRFGSCSVCAGLNHAPTHWGEVGPRLGFSYALNHSTVINGGVSLLWQQYTNNNGNFTNDGNAFGVGNYQYGNGTNQPGFGEWDTKTLNFPGLAQFSSGSLAGQSVGYFNPTQAGQNPYYLLWNEGVQRTLPHNWFIRASYVGQRGIHLVRGQMNQDLIPEGAPQRYGALLSQNINSPAAVAAGFTPPFANFSALLGSNATVGQALKPYPQSTSISNRFPSTGSMTYDAAQIEIDKRYTGGLSILSGLTLQHDVGNATSMLGWDGQNVYPVDPYHPHTDYAPIGPWYLINVAGTYDLPVGPGKTWFNNQGLTGQIIGGWKLAWTQYYGSSNPYTVSADGSPYGFGNLADRNPSVPIQTYSWHRVKDWALHGATGPYPVIIANNGAFIDPGGSQGTAVGQYIPGNASASYSQLRGPSYMIENLGAMKSFSIEERVRAILRVDYFNPLNRWYIGNCVDSNVDDGTFGEVTNPRCGSGQRTGEATFRVEF